MSGQLSMRSRFLAVFMLVFLIGAGTAYGVVSLFNQDIVRTLGRWFAEKSVLYEKSRVLQLLLREVVLSQKMASSPLLKAWVSNENDRELQARAMAELEDFRRFFRSKSYFLAIAESGHYYFDDGTADGAGRVRYTLDPAIEKDAWFYATLKQVSDYRLNVNADRVLKVTKVWVNTVLRDGGKPLAVIGTGVDLSDFIASVVRSSTAGVTNMLLDANGAIQAHPDVSVIDFASITKELRPEAQSTVFNLIDSPAQRNDFRRALDRLIAGGAQAQTLEVSIQGKRHIAGLTYLPEIRWVLATLTHPESAAAARYTTAIAAAVIGVLAITLLLAGLAFHHVVLRRLVALDAAAREIAAGNYAVALPHGGGDELGRLAASFRDMGKRIAAHTAELEREVAQRTEALERIAATDFLTGLFNRRGIIDRLQIERSRHGRQGRLLGVILLDLDHFKRLNDTHGHAAGDRVLSSVAGVIRASIRASDLCARWGGEEFLIILADLEGRSDLDAAAEKLREAVAASTVPVAGGTAALTASIGAYLAHPADDIDTMLRAADSALYAAKGAGRNRVVIAGEQVPQSDGAAADSPR